MYYSKDRKRQPWMQDGNMKTNTFERGAGDSIDSTNISTKEIQQKS